MSTLEKVEEEVRRLLAVWRCGDSTEAKYKYEAYEELIPFLESLEGKEDMFSGDETLEQACVKIQEECYDGYYSGHIENYQRAAMMGAQWQKEQMQHNVEAAKQFIKDCTKTCSNELISIDNIHDTTVISYHEWLTPEQAMRVVEIATEK